MNTKHKKIGAIAGLIGGLMGIYPIMLLRMTGIEYLVDVYGYNDMPTLLSILFMGIPLPANLWILGVAIGGIFFGIIGITQAQKRFDTLTKAQLWFWGWVSGFLINLFLSYWSI